jgi:hypothetical protein
MLSDSFIYFTFVTKSVIEMFQLQRRISNVSSDILKLCVMQVVKIFKT